MKFNPRNWTFVFSTLLIMATIARAETIRLKSGQTIEGTVVERTKDSVKVDTGVGVSITYYLDEIEEIAAASAQPPEPGPAADPIVPAPVAPSPAPVMAAPVQAPQTATAPAPASVSSTLTRKIEKKFPLYANVTSLPPWQAPRLNRDEYLTIQAERARAIEQEHINRIILSLTESLTGHWRGLKNAHPLVRTIAESPTGLAIAAIVWASVYALLCFPLMRLSQRFKCGGWLAWVPILQIFQLLRIADKSPIWFLFFLFPVINLLAFLFVWMSIARRLEQPYWLGYLMLAPGVNILLLWYLALLPIPATPKPQDSTDTGIRFE